MLLKPTDRVLSQTPWPISEVQHVSHRLPKPSMNLAVHFPIDQMTSKMNVYNTTLIRAVSSVESELGLLHCPLDANGSVLQQDIH